MHMIETERLILRPWQDDDAAALYRYASDPDVGLIAGWAPHTSVENSLEIIRTVFAEPEIYAMVLKDSGEPVGCCGITFANAANDDSATSKEGEIGYWIGKPYWGRGLTPEAVRALLGRGFDELGLDSLWCVYYEGNSKSKRVCEKCGFAYHHTVKDVVSPLADIRTEHHNLMTKATYASMNKSLSNNLIFRKAEEGDVTAATAILRAAARRMLAEGKRQWTESYPGEANVRSDIECGNGFVLEYDGTVAGYGAVVFTGEPAYDELEGEWLTDGPYVVVHRVAISQEMKGKGLGRAFLEAVEGYARSLGIRSFRIDTNYDNEAMLGLLAKLGFSYCGEVEYESGKRKAFEKLI